MIFFRIRILYGLRRRQLKVSYILKQVTSILEQISLKNHVFILFIQIILFFNETW